MYAKPNVPPKKNKYFISAVISPPNDVNFEAISIKEKCQNKQWRIRCQYVFKGVVGYVHAFQNLAFHDVSAQTNAEGFILINDARNVSASACLC
jgi:hypothetical protein